MSTDHPRPPEYVPKVHTSSIRDKCAPDINTMLREAIHVAKQRIVVQLPAGSNADMSRETAAMAAEQAQKLGHESRVVIRMDRDHRKAETLVKVDDINNDDVLLKILVEQNERVGRAVRECRVHGVPFFILPQRICNSELEVRFGIDPPTPDMKLPEHGTFMTMAGSRSLQKRMRMGAMDALHSRLDRNEDVPDVHIVHHDAPDIAKLSEWISLQLSRLLHATGGPDAVLDHVEGKGKLADLMAVAQHFKTQLEEQGPIKGPIVWARTIREYMAVRRAQHDEAASKNDVNE